MSEERDDRLMAFLAGLTDEGKALELAEQLRGVEAERDELAARLAGTWPPPRDNVGGLDGVGAERARADALSAPAYELVLLHVRRLSEEEREALAAGPLPGGDKGAQGTACRVCAVLRDAGYATGSYRSGERHAPDWLLNWHAADPLRCGVIYGIAAAIEELAVREYPVTNDRPREHELNLMNERKEAR